MTTLITRKAIPIGLNHLDSLIADKELIQDKIQCRAVDLEAQTEKMVEVDEERDLILEGVSQFLDIDHCVHTLSGMFIYFSSFLLSWNLVGFKNKILFFSIFF